MEFLILFIAVLVGAIVGWNLREAVAMHQVKTILNSLSTQQEEQSEEDDNRIRISVEKHNGVFYVYGRDNNEFMAQGSNRQELEDALKERYPGKRFACDEKTLLELGSI